MSSEFNLAINELLLNQCISTTSIMANGLAFDEAVELVRRNNLGNIGVHLALTRDDFTVKTPLIYRSISGGRSLVDESGELYTKPSVLKEKANYQDIVSEIEAQIKAVKDVGINITHIDNQHFFRHIRRKK